MASKRGHQGILAQIVSTDTLSVPIEVQSLQLQDLSVSNLQLAAILR